MTAGPRPASVRERWRAGGRAEIVVTLVPFTVTALIGVLLWLAWPFLSRLLEIEYALSSGDRLGLAGLVTAGVAIAGVATWTVLHAGGYSARRLCWQLGAVLVADLTLFNLFVVNPPITEAAAQAHTTLADQVATAGEGRFIIYDPDRFEFPSSTPWARSTSTSTGHCPAPRATRP